MNSENINVGNSGCCYIQKTKSPHHHRIFIEGEHQTFFYSKHQARNTLIEMFKANLITALQIVALSTIIEDLPIPFMVHPKERSKEDREHSEDSANWSFIFEVKEAHTKEKVMLTNKPQVGIHGAVDDDSIEAYILTPKYRSELFDNFEDGKHEVNKMLRGYRIDKEDCPELIKQIEEIFGGTIFKGGGYTIVYN